MRYKPKRSYSWNPAIAYSVGLMASDGCLQKDGRHIDLTSVDVEQLNNFSKALGRPLPISRKPNNSERPAFRVQLSDTGYYDFLTTVGLTPIKSKTIAMLAVPDEFYADFLRGVFDGDGTTYGYFDRRWRSSFMFYTGFASASLPFLYYLQNLNQRLIGITKGSIRTGTRAYSLVYAKADSRRIADFMYYAADVLCLTRKRVKLEGFTKERATGIIL